MLFHCFIFRYLAGLNTVENTLTNSELQQRRLQILQACGCKSSIGCARIEQQFKIGYKSKCVTGILSFPCSLNYNILSWISMVFKFGLNWTPCIILQFLWFVGMMYHAIIYFILDKKILWIVPWDPKILHLIIVILS